MRYWEGNFCETFGRICNTVPVEAHSCVCDEMLRQSSSNYHLFGCVSGGICKGLEMLAIFIVLIFLNTPQNTVTRITAVPILPAMQERKV